ncbi:DUF2062 domain-containing protein [Myxococcota bacterium]|nr:DUF2062 domain-containing protein [Myxococcota bacterium]MBU1432945.1 DUF2062 domain-containing protein [Myxococcota bacterium]MBU1896247.1 DUF2062 domain-containing protein [Myxococcota bacterium]
MPQLSERLKQTWQKLLALDDSPHNIALGVALGTFVAYQPIVGIQMVVGAIVCRIFGANIAASLPMAWITNPLTIAPIFYMTYLIGRPFTGGEMSYEDIARIFSQIDELGFWAGIVEGYRFLKSVFVPMVVGGAIVGVINGALFYFLSYRLIVKHRQRRARTLEARMAKKAARQARREARRLAREARAADGAKAPGDEADLDEADPDDSLDGSLDGALDGSPEPEAEERKREAR